MSNDHPRACVPITESGGTIAHAGLSFRTPMDARERLIQQSHFEDEVFADVELDGADLSDKDFIRCAFRTLRFRDSQWHGARLEDCTFESCDLGGIRVK